MAKQSRGKSKRPTVSIIGVGRMGAALAQGLSQAGYPVAALVYRNAAQAASRRSLFPGFPVYNSEHLELLPASDLLIIATPDDAIGPTAKKLAKSRNKGYEVVLHTSGALSSEVLAPLSALGLSAGSMHPLASISYSFSGASALIGAPYCIEGDPAAVSVARNIAKDLQGESFQIKTEDKVLYHAAAVIASPHLIALFDVSLELLNRIMNRNDAAKLLLRLVENTVANLHVNPPLTGVRDPSWALTGTFARGDVGVVARHLDALTSGTPKPSRDALDLYKLLGLRSLQLAKQHGLDPKKISKIRKLLQSESPKRPKH
jgi:predicted short-subunit dehydrogenase-like oxidoreductase (DUF2520 family)